MSQEALPELDLLRVAASNDARRVGELLEDGVDSNSRDVFDGSAALHRAAENGSVEIAGLLIAYGADVNARTLDTDSSPLGIAALAGWLPIVQLLLSKGGKLSPAEMASGLLEEVKEIGDPGVYEALTSAGM